MCGQNEHFALKIWQNDVENDLRESLEFVNHLTYFDCGLFVSVAARLIVHFWPELFLLFRSHIWWVNSMKMSLIVIHKSFYNFWLYSRFMSRTKCLHTTNDYVIHVHCISGRSIKPNIALWKWAILAKKKKTFRKLIQKGFRILFVCSIQWTFARLWLETNHEQFWLKNVSSSNTTHNMAHPNWIDSHL